MIAARAKRARKVMIAFPCSAGKTAEKRAPHLFLRFFLRVARAPPRITNESVLHKLATEPLYDLAARGI
jgi:hypothetical protein